MANIQVESPNVAYTADHIESRYSYQTTEVSYSEAGNLVCTPKETNYTFRTERKVPKLGVMLVGWGGNNGSTVTGAILANKLGLQWETKEGMHKADYYGSITQASTVLLGSGAAGDVYVPFKTLLPFVDPNDLVIDGWDINSMDLAGAMHRAAVFDIALQKQLSAHMSGMKPRPSIYYPDFIAANQSDRADNVIPGADKQAHVERIREDIRHFRNAHQLDKVIVLWTANTERFAEVQPGLNDTADNLLKSIKNSHPEVSASTVFAVASILEGCCYINGAPQNTFVPGCIELAERCKVFIGGDDFKSGQTKVKSVLADFLVSAGIKPTSIVSYNHLGNNDGKNLSSQRQFRSKEVSKRSVVDDMVESNNILYRPGEHPDHCIVIKYVPYVGDSKRAMDEYTSEIMMGGRNTLVLHNTCEDSLLAAPLILDLVILAEMCQRINFKVDGDDSYQKFHSILTILSYLLKAPLVPEGTPLINALFRQKACIENMFRACLGLAPLNHMNLEHKHEDLRASGAANKKKKGFGAPVASNGVTNGAVNGILNGNGDGVKITGSDSEEGEK